MQKFWSVAAAFAALGVVACAPSPCDRNASADTNKKLPGCEKPLGDPATCQARVKSCSDADSKELAAMFDCIDKNSSCQASQPCFDKLQGLSQPCRESLFGSGPLPGQDGGADGGEDGGVDAGVQPTDGGAIALIVVADENNFALAWTTNQTGNVAQWIVSEVNSAGIRAADVPLPAAQTTYGDPDGGNQEKRTYWVAGYASDGKLVIGQVASSDAGQQVGCQNLFDCNIDQVCDVVPDASVRQCQTQPCTTSDTCPGGYLCNNVGSNKHCVRQIYNDAGTFDAGSQQEVPLPFVSPSVAATIARPVGFSPEIFVSPFDTGGAAPRIVAIDSARQFIALEQQGQIFGHLSLRRGQDFPLPLTGTRHVAQIDTVGKNVHVAFVPDAGTIYACYNVANDQGVSTVRVRRSHDLGRSWGTPTEYVEVSNLAAGDGGVEPSEDCDIAPWSNGRAAMATIDGDKVVMRIVSDTLVMAPPIVAFQATPQIYLPSHPAIATWPPKDMVHIGFTGTRLTDGGISDTEVYDAYTDSSLSGNFQQVVRINDNGITAGSPYPQDYANIVIDGTRSSCPGVNGTTLPAPCALAAFTSLEQNVGSSTYNVVYLSTWNGTTKHWGTGSDLSVFFLDTQTNSYPVMQDPKVSSTWFAFSPTLSVTPAGKVFLSFIAGDSNPAPNFYPYIVQFNWDKADPYANVNGWFEPPARKMGSVVSMTPQAVGGGVYPTVSASATDSQLSHYTAFIEGVGPSNATPNRAAVISRP